MENFRKKNPPMVIGKMQGKKISEKKSKERQHVLRKLSVNGWKTLEKNNQPMVTRKCKEKK